MNAMHVRTYELTNADTSKTESESHVSNAHERTRLIPISEFHLRAEEAS